MAQRHAGIVSPTSTLVDSSALHGDARCAAAVTREWNREAERIKAGGRRVRPVRGSREEEQRRDEKDDPATAWRGDVSVRAQTASKDEPDGES